MDLQNDYIKTEEIEEADAILVRSASMHEMELPENIQRNCPCRSRCQQHSA